MREDGIFKRIDRGFYCSKRKGIFFLAAKKEEQKGKVFFNFPNKFFRKDIKITELFYRFCSDNRLGGNKGGRLCFDKFWN